MGIEKKKNLVGNDDKIINGLMTKQNQSGANHSSKIDGERRGKLARKGQQGHDPVLLDSYLFKARDSFFSKNCLRSPPFYFNQIENERRLNLTWEKF